MPPEYVFARRFSAFPSPNAFPISAAATSWTTRRSSTAARLRRRKCHEFETDLGGIVVRQPSNAQVTQEQDVTCGETLQVGGECPVFRLVSAIVIVLSGKISRYLQGRSVGVQPLRLGAAGPACLNLAIVGEVSTELMPDSSSENLRGGRRYRFSRCVS
jgi:hypothetical protein